MLTSEHAIVEFEGGRARPDRLSSLFGRQDRPGADDQLRHPLRHGPNRLLRRRGPEGDLRKRQPSLAEGISEGNGVCGLFDPDHRNDSVTLYYFQDLIHHASPSRVFPIRMISTAIFRSE